MIDDLPAASIMFTNEDRTDYVYEDTHHIGFKKEDEGGDSSKDTYFLFNHVCFGKDQKECNNLYLVGFYDLLSQKQEW